MGFLGLLTSVLSCRLIVPRGGILNFPLRSSNLVFKAALRVLMVTSACPLDCGCAGDE